MAKSNQTGTPEHRSSRIEDPREETVTVSFRFPRVLNRTLKIYSAEHDVSQNELVAKALIAFLIGKGIQWDQPPVIQWKDPSQKTTAA